nr:MAG TPA_asm: hypothetical protein [Caudoviricetes sp.]
MGRLVPLIALGLPGAAVDLPNQYLLLSNRSR